MLQDFATTNLETTNSVMTKIGIKAFSNDGLTEALNEQNQLFGRKRVVQLLTGCANKTPKEVVDTIITEVKQYAGNMEQGDDLTLLVIRRS